VVALALLLAGCPKPAPMPRYFVTCALPNGIEMRTATLDAWQYESGGWVGYHYSGSFAVIAERVSYYVPVQGSICQRVEVRP
jgi:hypothetical protein